MRLCCHYNVVNWLDNMTQWQEERIGHPKVNDTESKYKEKYRRLMDQFFNGINDGQKIEELTAIKNWNEVTNEQVLSWAKQIEA